ncbi:MAG: serine protease [Candidatus Pacebacteria bacterium]|nr:serine protease [Candidatus Paceibacterota bacterium]
MFRSKEHLLLANFPDNNYANAFILRHLIITAGHVAGAPLNIETNDKTESGQFSYQIASEQDLAISRQQIPSAGYELGSSPEIGDNIIVCGHHGPEQLYFEIEAVVSGFDQRGRIIIKRQKGKIFQLGMSGCPALNTKNQVIGVLVEGVKGTKGQEVYLETVKI